MLIMQLVRPNRTSMTESKVKLSQSTETGFQAEPTSEAVVCYKTLDRSVSHTRVGLTPILQIFESGRLGQAALRGNCFQPPARFNA